jgi:hypothetical protein
MPLSLPGLIRLSGLADQTGLIRPKPSICSKLKISLRYKMDEIGHSFHVIADVSVSRGVRWFSYGKKERDPCDFLSVMFGITSSSAQPYVTSVLIFGHPELQVWGPCRILMILRRVDGIFKLFF